MQKVAVVTGAAQGIGQAIALKLSDMGFLVVANDLQDSSVIAGKIEGKGGVAIGFDADIAAGGTFAAIFEEATHRFGGVDVLVNNAGIMIRKPIAEITDEEFDRQMGVNLKGTFNGLREAARHLRPGGRIISISSSVATMASANYGIYGASKTAIETMTKVLAKELQGRNISVNAVAPGATSTPMFLEGKAPAAIEAFARLSPLERIGEPEEIAALVAFLAGPEGGWINGQIIHANGGVI